MASPADVVVTTDALAPSVLAVDSVAAVGLAPDTTVPTLVVAVLGATQLSTDATTEAL